MSNNIKNLVQQDLTDVCDRPESLFVPSLNEITKLGKDLAKQQKNWMFKNKGSMKVYFEESMKAKRAKSTRALQNK